MPTAEPGPVIDVTVPDGCPDPHTALADDRDTFAAVAAAAQTAADHPDNPHVATAADRYIADLTDAWTRTRYPTLVNIAAGLSRRSRHSSRDDALHAVHAAVLDLVSDIRRDRRPIANIPALLTTKARWKLRVLAEADTCGFTGTSGIQRRRHRINRARADHIENTGHEPDPADLVAHTNRLFPARGHDSPVTAADLTPPPSTVALDPHPNRDSSDDGDSGGPRSHTWAAEPGFDHDSCEQADADRMWSHAREAALHLDPAAGRLMHNAWILYRTDDMLPTRTEVGYLLDLPPARAAVHRAIMVEILRRVAGTIYDRNTDPPWRRTTRSDGTTVYTPADRHPYSDAEAAAWITAWLARANNQHTIVDRVPKRRRAVVHHCDHATCTAAAADMPDRTPIHPFGETINTSQLTITQPDLDFDHIVYDHG